MGLIPKSFVRRKQKNKERAPSVPYHVFSIGETEAKLQTSILSGLDDAEVERRKTVYGMNEFPDPQGKKVLKLLLMQFCNTPTLILFAAALLTFAIKDWVAAGTIVVVTVSNSLVGFGQEYVSEKNVSSLRKTTSSTAVVSRNGGLVSTIPARELVPGDIIILKSGDKIPADARIIEGFNFEVDESTLTGESLSVSKTEKAIGVEKTILAARTCMVYMGTSVTNGRAKAIVVETGIRTELGAVNVLLVHESSQDMKTPLQKALSKLYILLLVLAVFLIFVVFSVSKFVVTRDVALYAVSLGIAIIPESLVAVVTLALSLGVKRMSKCRAIVRNLSAMVFIGAATDICSDKTGTLTTGKMRVEHVIVHGEEQRTVIRSTLTESARFVDEHNTEVDVRNMSDGCIKMIECAAMCNNATITRVAACTLPRKHENVKKHRNWFISFLKRKRIIKFKSSQKHKIHDPSSQVIADGDWVASGSPTEIALMAFANLVGMSKMRLSDPETGKYSIEVEYPFDSTVKIMSVLLVQRNRNFAPALKSNEDKGYQPYSRGASAPSNRVKIKVGDDLHTTGASQDENNDADKNGQKNAEDNQELEPVSDSPVKDAEENSPNADKPNELESADKSSELGSANKPNEPEIIVFTKGSLEAVFNACTSRWDSAKKDYVKFKDIEEKKMVSNEVNKNLVSLASKGLRVLAFAFRRIPNSVVGECIEEHNKKSSHTGEPPFEGGDQADTSMHAWTSVSIFKHVPRSVLECDMTFLGLAGLVDPPRPETADAIRECSRAGIVVRMLTGDHPATAENIAYKIGILGPDYYADNDAGYVSVNDRLIWTGEELESLTDRQVDTLPHLPLVISRCTPSTKVKMVNAIKRRGGIIAMTGDGVNDAPSLKGAHVGIAMGKGGSDVAKESSDMILTDDNFATIVTAVAQGRRIFANLLKFVSHLMITNIAEIIALVIGLAISDPKGVSIYPMSPMQLLFMNMITSSPPAMALSMEPPRRYQMISSKYRGGQLFKKPIVIDMFYYGVVMGILTLSTFVYVLQRMSNGSPLGVGCNEYYKEPVEIDGVVYGECDSIYRARTTAYVTMVYLTLYQSFVCRNRLQTTWHWHQTQKVNVALILCVVFGLLIVIPTIYIRVIAEVFFRSKAISKEWLCVLVAFLVYVFATEVYKYVLRKLEARQGLDRIDTTAEFMLEERS